MKQLKFIKTFSSYFVLFGAIVISMFFLVGCKDGKQKNQDKVNELCEVYNENISLFEQTGAKNDKYLLISKKAIGRAIVIDGENSVLYAKKASVCLKLKKYDEAREALEKIIELKKDYPEIYLLLGIINEKQNKVKEASDLYRKTLDLLQGEVSSNGLNATSRMIYAVLIISGKAEALKKIEALDANKITKLQRQQLIEVINSFTTKEEFVGNII